MQVKADLPSLNLGIYFVAAGMSYASNMYHYGPILISLQLHPATFQGEGIFQNLILKRV